MALELLWSSWDRGRGWNDNGWALSCHTDGGWRGGHKGAGVGSTVGAFLITYCSLSCLGRLSMTETEQTTSNRFILGWIMESYVVIGSIFCWALKTIVKCTLGTKFSRWFNNIHKHVQTFCGHGAHPLSFKNSTSWQRLSYKYQNI